MGWGIVSSHSLTGRAWALHTGDTKSAARDTLLDVCTRRPPQLPPPSVCLPQIWERNAASYGDFFNEDEFLRVTGGYGCCSGLSFPLPDPIISFLIHQPEVGKAHPHAPAAP